MERMRKWRHSTRLAAVALAGACLFSALMALGFSFPKAKQTQIWTSKTSGYDYKVRVAGRCILIDWVKLPPRLQHTPAFVRSQLKKSGDKWKGNTTAYLPFDYLGKTHWCRVRSSMEIDSVSSSKIEGRSRMIIQFDAAQCRPEKMEWKQFIWVPKR